jgi:hypothetical protein
MTQHILTCGDIVKLKEPYRPEEWVYRQPQTWKGFEFGIVVQIVSCQFSINGDRYGDGQTPRNVSLHLYDAAGQLMIEPLYLEQGLLIPSYVDYHVSELVLYKIASESGYIPVPNPPNWDKVWEQEQSVLEEFL